MWTGSEWGVGVEFGKEDGVTAQLGPRRNTSCAGCRSRSTETRPRSGDRTTGPECRSSAGDQSWGSKCTRRTPPEVGTYTRDTVDLIEDPAPGSGEVG